MLDTGQIVPVLDGLDEIPESLRWRAIARLNDSTLKDPRLVLTSRTEPYRDAVRPSGEEEMLLLGATGIELCSLDNVAVITEYLGGSPGSSARHRWHRVLTELSKTPASPVAQALTTPLMLSLARTIYSPRRDQYTGALPDPEELLNFPDCRQIEQHLFDGFIRAAYRPHPDPAYSSPWSAEQADRWFELIARLLQHCLEVTDFRWRDVSAAIPGWIPRLVFVLVFGLLTAWVAGPMAGLAAGFAAVIVVGLPVGLPVGRKPSDREEDKWDEKLLIGLGFGLSAGLLPGLLVAAIVGPWLHAVLGFVLGVLLTIELGIVIGLATGDDMSLLGGCMAFIALGLTVVLAFGFPVALWAWLVVSAGFFLVMFIHLKPPERGGLWSSLGIGLLVGLLVGVGIGLGALWAVWLPVGWIGPLLAVVLGIAFTIGLGVMLVIGVAAGQRRAGLWPRFLLGEFVVGLTVVAIFRHPVGFWLWIGLGVLLMFVLLGVFLRFGFDGLLAFAALVVVGLPINGLGVGVGAWLAARFPVAAEVGVVVGPWPAAGLAAGLIFELSMVRTVAAAMAWFWLALWRKLPWRFRSFLDDAHRQRGVLRQVGAVYQLRHAELQRRLATRPSGMESQP